MRRNARIIWTLARDAGLSRERAREMISASFGESRLGTLNFNTSGATGLFQLKTAGYQVRARRLGGILNPRANACAILPNYAAYWRVNPKVGPGVCAANVEGSGSNASYYSAALSWLQSTFRPITVKPCPRLKPLCAKSSQAHDTRTRTALSMAANRIPTFRFLVASVAIALFITLASSGAATQPTALNFDQRPPGLTPQGLLLWNFEGLLRRSFPGSSEVSAKVDPRSSYNFVCRGDCSPHAVYSRYRYIFAAPKGSAFHLSSRKFSP